jgi:hypothetical protein
VSSGTATSSDMSSTVRRSDTTFMLSGTVKLGTNYLSSGTATTPGVSVLFVRRVLIRRALSCMVPTTCRQVLPLGCQELHFHPICGILCIRRMPVHPLDATFVLSGTEISGTATTLDESGTVRPSGTMPSGTVMYSTSYQPSGVLNP